MSLRTVLSDTAIAESALRAAGTYSSDAMANAGAAVSAVVLVHILAVGGSSQTLNVKVQTSPDATTWTDVVGGAGAQLTAVGNTTFNAAIDDNYFQVVAVVGGTGSPTVTFRVDVLVLQG